VAAKATFVQTVKEARRRDTPPPLPEEHPKASAAGPAALLPDLVRPPAFTDYLLAAWRDGYQRPTSRVDPMIAHATASGAPWVAHVAYDLNLKTRESG
jgi:hypothetical protein